METNWEQNARDLAEVRDQLYKALEKAQEDKMRLLEAIREAAIGLNAASGASFKRDNETHDNCYASLSDLRGDVHQVTIKLEQAYRK